MLWQELSDARVAGFDAWFKVAEIALTMVGGSVEDERTFSTLSFIKNDLRSRMQEEHLNAAMRLYDSKRTYTMSTFPFFDAFLAWDGCIKHRGVLN